MISSSAPLLPTLFVLALALCPGGCSKSQPSAPAKEERSSSPRTAPSPPVTAPHDWHEFLAWAGNQLGRPVPPVPFPSGHPPPRARWTVLRLDELIGQAEILCPWRPPPTGPKALASLGPFRSDRPGPAFGVENKTRGFPPSTWLRFGGFDLHREQIGSIVIELRQPIGSYFTLIWSQLGQLRVPVPDQRRFWTLRLATDGLADWSGRLRQISLRTDDIADEPVEIRSIRFLRREDSFPEPVGLRRVRVGREIRTAVYAHAPAQVRFDGITIPPRARLQTGLGLVTGTAGPTSEQSGQPPATTSAPVHFRAYIEFDGRRTPVIDENVAQGRSWRDLDCSLEAWSGNMVTVELNVASEASSVVACWANPTIYQALDDPPAAIVYLIDALGAKHVDLYGYPRPTMPRLRALAERGAWFSNMFANSPRTVESVADLMLSLPTARHGVFFASTMADSRLVTLAEAMHSAGFATASFATNVYAGPRQNMDQGFESFFDEIASWTAGDADRTVPIDAVLRWMRARPGRPKFIYIHTAEPHSPYAPPPGFAGRFDPDYHGKIDGTHDPAHGFTKARTPRDLAHVVALYDEEVAYADERLGLFVDALTDAGLLENAYLFVTADHGEEFLEHGFWEHEQDLHNELIRIPLVVLGPDLSRRGRIDVPAQLHDLMPTIMDLFELPAPYALAGGSLLPLLRRPLTRTDNIELPTSLSTDLHERTIVATNHAYRGEGFVEYAVIESGRWKLMYRYAVPTEAQGDMPLDPDRREASRRFALFDLHKDHGERHDVLDEHASVGRRLIGQLLAWRAEQAPFDFTTTPEVLKLDPAQLRDLRDLGYVGP